MKVPFIPDCFRPASFEGNQRGLTDRIVFVVPACVRLLGLLLIGTLGIGNLRAQPDFGISKEIWTPREWQPKLLRSNRDLNQNFVEDKVDAMNPNERINVVLDLNDCPMPVDLDRFARFGRVAFVGQYISVICLENVQVKDAIQLGLDERVAMVEFDHVGELTLDRSVQNIRVSPSATHSPNTVRDLYPAVTGIGVNIAILDSGVDDAHETITFPTPRFVAGYDAFADTEVNPVDDNGHGTHVAGIALGTGGPSGTFGGVAPGAGLVDIKVADAGGFVPTAVLLRGIERCILRRTTWNIGVANLSLGFCSLIDNGTHALSQAVNRMVRADIVVVVAIGNTGNCGVPNNTSMVIAPGAADDALTVGASNDQGSANRGISTLATFSLTGPRTDDLDGDATDEQKPDVVAPGATIRSAQAGNPVGYLNFNGTSMAAPHVAGLAALIRQVVPAMTPYSVRKLIRDTAEDKGALGWDSFWGHGLVNGFAAIDQLMSTLKTDLRFVENCTSPNPANWLSADLFPVDPTVEEGEANTIQANIHNNGLNPAVNFQVRLGVYGFSNGQLDYNICTVNVPGPLNAGATMSVSCPWTPGVIGLPPGTVHACLKGEIVTPFDTSYGNNCSQHNIDIKQTASPAHFRLRVANPTGRDVLVVVSNDLPINQELWTFQMTNPPVRMAAQDCPRVLDVTLTPRVGVQGQQRVNLAMIGIVEETGERFQLGGVTIQGFVPTPNEAPIARPDLYGYQPNRTLEIAAPGLLINDSDGDTNQILAAVLVTPAEHGEVILLADGSFRYTPSPGYEGPDVFVYQASDGRARSFETTVALNSEVRPTLRILRSNAVITISWTVAPGFILEESTNVTGPWSQRQNQGNPQAFSTESPTQFFRLRK